LTAFIVVPLLELALLFQIKDVIGWMETIAVVVVTGVIGAFLAKQEGLLVLSQIRLELAQGRVPAARLIDGVMILVAGALLITPGLITDAAGFALLIPAARNALRVWLRHRLEQKLADGSLHITFRG
jgi:UPF0716 protein FxsA